MVQQEMDSFELFSKINNLCKKITEDQKNIELFHELRQCIVNSSPSFIKAVQKCILATFYPYMKQISGNRKCFSNDQKQLIVETLKHLLDKIPTENSLMFFNFYSLLLFEIYDYNEHKVLQLSEEYKESILECVISLVKSLTPDLIQSIYVKENAPKLSQIIYVASEIAKKEKSKKLRCTAIKSIMAIAKVLDDDDFNDTIIRNHIAEVFLFFLPGISTTLTEITLQDPKIGHIVPLNAIRALGRVITLVMQDYNSCDDKITFKDIKFDLDVNLTKIRKVKWKNKEEIDEYLGKTKRTIKWYSETDKNLLNLFVKLSKLTHHDHVNVRLELIETSNLILENCLSTMPLCINKLIEILIVLSEDEASEVCKKSRNVLENLSKKLPENHLKSVIESMEDSFCNAVLSLPRKFNSIDDKEKSAALNLIIGYINLFGEHNLAHALLAPNVLNQLMTTLLHISQLENSKATLLEESSIQEFDHTLDTKTTPWLNFRYFNDDGVKAKLNTLCSLLSKYGTFKIVSDFLLDILLDDIEHTKEAIFLLNEIISATNINHENLHIIKNVIVTYTDCTLWDVPITVLPDSEITLIEAHNNVIQVCLLTDGVGKIALNLHQNFRQFLLKTLYIVLERAGSPVPLIRHAGLAALSNICSSCGYPSVTDLITSNIDYFSYHVERKLNKIQDNEGVLNVIAVILKYSNIDVLHYIKSIIEEVLMQSCDRFKASSATSFLRIFKIFIQCLHKWLNIEIKQEPIKSKYEKEKEIEHFQVSGINYQQEHEEMEQKTVEEMYKEDMEKKKIEEQEMCTEEVEEPTFQECKKPEPPTHIKLTVAILTRSLHFLPSKNKTRKLLVLEILIDGVEVLKDFEDELLPIVHQIWSPLVQRFREFDNPLIINYSFKLLATLARLSKDFIRMRTTKEVLPHILEVVEKFSKESYLKDKGSSYRYTQAYKLQLNVLENLGEILVDIDVQDKHFEDAINCVFKYLSEKQPVPLQNAALHFFKVLHAYDADLIKKWMNMWKTQKFDNEFEKNVTRLFDCFDK